MTISAENVFGPKARSTRTGASHVVRVDRGATRECAEVRETQSRRVICRYSCPMLQMGLPRAAAGATDAFAASAASQTDARPRADAQCALSRPAFSWQSPESVSSRECRQIYQTARLVCTTGNPSERLLGRRPWTLSVNFPAVQTHCLPPGRLKVR